MRIASLSFLLFLLPVLGAKPNVVFFFIDDMGWTDLGYMGSKYYESPHIDQLAKEGMVFMNAYAAAPNCAPSRACLMSGQYSPRHGVYTVSNSDRGSSKHRKLIPIKNTIHLAEKFITLGEAFKAGGYVTATMGKWHLGEDPTTQGFDVNVAGKSWGSPSGGGYHSPYKYPNLEQKEKGEYLTDRLGKEACKFIEKNKDNSFFLYLTHYAVHTPIQAKPELKKKYEEKKASKNHKNASYAAMIESTDDSVGAVLGKLKDLGLSENTIIVFFSDNGGHGGVTSNAPLRGSKGMLYEGGIREPMIIKWPGVTKPGSICQENVIGVDFYPTLLKATGTPVPKGYILDGVSLVPLLKDAKTKLRRKAIHWHFPAYLQGYTARHGHFRTTPGAATRMGDWKLLEFFEDNTLELYNTSEDISETKDLAKEMPNKVKELHKAMLAWRKKVKAPVPTKLNPEYDPRAAKPSPKNKRKKRS
jgi:arylsulfatase A-like enzyme